jgi:hypothetical protein
MDITQLLNRELAEVVSGNNIYQTYKPQWMYLLQSYLGGEEYRRAAHLTRYNLETETEYNSRLRATPLENHCASVCSLFSSFIFRESAERDFGGIATDNQFIDFIEDCDYEGRSWENFMKEVFTWSTVFGHCWTIMAKPNINAVSRAEEIANGVRPYVNLLTPLTVLDWCWTRMPNGKFELDYFKYLEDINGDIHTVKIWDKENIRTVVVNVKDGYKSLDISEPNMLGIIPATICYSNRSSVRGIGCSSIADIADMQRFIYNCTSEIEQNIRLASHPSLVMTPDTQAGTGAGSIIHIQDNLDSGLKPYLLETNGSSVTSIYEAINHAIESVDKMANTGATRSNSASVMSGVARDTEFQLLNAKLSQFADNLELAEEQMLQLWCLYQGYQWTGSIEYPDSFNIRDTGNEITNLKIAADTNPADPRVKAAIDVSILDWLDLDEDELAALANTTIMTPDTIQETGELPEDS